MKVSEVYEGAEVVHSSSCVVCGGVDSVYHAHRVDLSRFMVGVVIFVLVSIMTAYIVFNIVLMHTNLVIK